MPRKVGPLRASVVRVRSDPRLLGTGLGSLLVTVVGVLTGAAVFEGAVGWSVTGTARGFLGLVVTVAIVRSVVLTVPSAVVAGTGGRDEAIPSGGGSPLGRTVTAMLAIPALLAVGGVVTLVAAVPVLAGYGVLVTGLQAAGYAVADGPVLEPNYVWAGLFFVALPAAVAVAVGVVGPLLPAITRGASPVTALRDGVGRFLRDPAARLRYGILVVVLALSPAVVLAAGAALSAVSTPLYAVSVGAAPVVGVAAYAVGPLYRTETARHESGGSRDRSGGRRQPVTSRRRLTAPRIAAILVLSSAVLGGVGLVRVAELRPVGPGPDTPGFDGSDPPTVAVREAGEATIEADRKVEWEFDEDPGTANDQEGVILVDPDRDRWFWLRVEPRSYGGDGVHVAAKYRDRNVEIGWGDFRNGSLTDGVGPAAGLDLEQTDRDPAGSATVALDGTGPGADIGRDVSARTSALWRVADAPNGSFEVDDRVDGTVVFRTTNVENYCELREYRCDVGTQGPTRVSSAGLRVVVDAETGYVERVVDTRIVEDEGKSVRSIYIWTFDLGPVEIDRPDSVHRGWKELLVDLVVY